MKNPPERPEGRAGGLICVFSEGPSAALQLFFGRIRRTASQQSPIPEITSAISARVSRVRF